MIRQTLLAVLLLCSGLAGYCQTSDTAIVRILQAHGVDFTHNNRVTLLPSGHEKFEDMFNAIRQAKSSVHLEYFNFRNDSIASCLFELLREKVGQGVEVRALFDGFGNDSNNRPLKKKHIRKLRSDGIEIYEFDPVRFPWINHVFTRDHRKIVVIDGQVAYTGGMNVADYYINGTDQVGEWRDMHCRIEGDAVNELQRIFLRMWNKVTKQQIGGDRYFRGGTDVTMEGLKPDTTSTSGRKTIGIVNREPRTSNEIIRRLYISALDEAQDSVRIINPYFTLKHSVKKAFRRALKRGVKVEIMVSAKSDIPLTPDAVFYYVYKLMKRGAHVWLYQPGFHHSKIMTVDNEIGIIGTANLDGRSLRYDYEVNAVVFDPQVTKELKEIFRRSALQSQILTPKNFRQRFSLKRRFVGRMFQPIKGLL